ncbi:hypothetical protein GO986_00600 [Deinococcus sp. HMF7620]|uniref:Uncharacterized protein n=1 Tax=Deinococcus arboris TaxID=2682977 RepID=A0A7C9HVF5_9DEIO|nr:hypothetical protein [Deinococcus arboris]MVN85270.1 hypothetical protein [Deinococcus arboris]
MPVLTGLRLVHYGLKPQPFGGVQAQVQLRADGPDAALQAVTRFFHGGWLQDSPEFLTAVLALLPGRGVNLREEGQVIRQGDRLHLWSGMTYFERTAEADLEFHEVCEVVRLNLHLLTLKREWLTSPSRRGLPSYEEHRGFRVQLLRPESESSVALSGW